MKIYKKKLGLNDKEAYLFPKVVGRLETNKKMCLPYSSGLEMLKEELGQRPELTWCCPRKRSHKRGTAGGWQ